MLFRFTVATTLSVMVLSAADAHAETQAEIRAIIGDVVLIDAALFTANRAFHRMICQPYRFETYATGISRLEYGSMTSSEKSEYEVILKEQMRGNLALKDELTSETHIRSVCRSLEDSMGDYILAFRDEHPTLFEKK